MAGALSVIGKISAATGLITLAGQLLNKNGMLWSIYNGIKDSSASDKAHQLLDMIQRADRTGGTLAQYTSQMRIVTRVFIDSSIEDEPIIPNLCRAERGWYVAQVLSALKLNQLVTDGVSVQDVLGLVQTGDNAHYHNAGMSALKRFAGMESLFEKIPGFSARGMSQEDADSDYQRELEAAVKRQSGTPEDKYTTMLRLYMKYRDTAAGKKVEAALATAAISVATAGVKKMIDRLLPNADKRAQEEYERAKAELGTVKSREELLGIVDKYHLDRRTVEKQLAELDAPFKVEYDRVDLEKLNGIAIGELYNVTLQNPKDKTSVEVPVFIQMTPISVPFRVAPRFIDRMTTPSVWQRWTMMTAGEIEFFRDFIGQRDRIKEKIKHDDPESLRALKTFLQTVHSKDKYSLADVASRRDAGNMSQNLANSVMIFSEDTVRQAYADSGIDLHNDADRTRYFAATYSMIISIVNPAFGEVVTYINGIDGAIKFKYSALKSADKNFDPVNLIQAMAALGDGKAPTLR